MEGPALYGQRFFAPVIISGVEDRAAGTVDVHLTSDLLTDDHGTAHWHAYTPDGSVLDEGSIEVSIPSRQDTRITTLDFSTLLDRHGTHRLVVWLELETDAGHESRSVVLFERPKKIDWEPAVMATSISGSGDQYEITLLGGTPGPVDLARIARPRLSLLGQFLPPQTTCPADHHRPAGRTHDPR